MMAQEKKLAIVIPTYNEKDNIFNIVSEIGHALQRQNIKVILIIVDDNSPDGTANLIKRNIPILKENFNFMDIQVNIREGKLGLGSAYIFGFKKALEQNCDYILEMDADLSHQPKYIPLFLESIQDKDIIIGSRYIRGGSTENWSFRRRLLSRSAGLYARTILGMKVQDMTAGFVMYKSNVLKAINIDQIKSNGFSFQIEMKYNAFKKGFTIKEIPIIFPDRVKGASKMNRSIILEALIGVWKLKFSRNK